MDIYITAAQKIIQEQQAVIGPIALDQARRVAGLEVSASGEVTKITGNGKEILNFLVRQYEKLFGRASIDVCKDAVKEVKPPITPEQLPDILK